MTLKAQQQTQKGCHLQLFSQGTIDLAAFAAYCFHIKTRHVFFSILVFYDDILTSGVLTEAFRLI